MQTVKDLLRNKGNDIYSINSSQSVFEALMMLAEKNVGALLVMEEKRLVGIISERDYARKVILKGASSLETPIKKIMTERLISVSPDQDIEECLSIMTERHVRHLPVMDNGQLVGFLSIGDLVKAALDKKDRIIEKLSGGRGNS